MVFFGFPAEFDDVVLGGCLFDLCAVDHLCELVSGEFHVVSPLCGFAIWWFCCLKVIGCGVVCQNR